VINPSATSLTLSFAPPTAGGTILNGGYQVGFRHGLLPAPPFASAVGYKTQTFEPVIALGADPTLPTLNGNLQPFNFFGVSWKSIGVVQNADGSITITGGTGDGFGAQLCTAASNGGEAPGYFKV
jgi:hypothetical protein